MKKWHCAIPSLLMRRTKSIVTGHVEGADREVGLYWPNRSAGVAPWLIVTPYLSSHLKRGVLGTNLSYSSKWKIQFRILFMLSSWCLVYFCIRIVLEWFCFYRECGDREILHVTEVRKFEETLCGQNILRTREQPSIGKIRTSIF